MTSQELPRPQDKIEILKRISLFASCAVEELQLIAERSRLVEYKKGEAVYHEGERADAFYVVASGRLQIFTDVDGRKELYTVLHNGDTFGEISLLTGESHSATVEALNDTLVLRLAKDDFEELINRIPSLVLHLSRLLSKRLRTKNHPTKTGEATVVAIYSGTKGVGRTLFSVALAAALKRETNREVIIVDFNTPTGALNQFFGIPKHTPTRIGSQLSPWSAEALEQEVLEHPLAFHALYAGDRVAGPQGELLVAPILSSLTPHYGYVLLDLPAELDPTVFKSLIQSDLIYLLTDCAKDSVIRTNALIRQIRSSVTAQDEKIKIILNLMDGEGERLTPSEAGQLLDGPVASTLPHIEDHDGEISVDDLIRLVQDPEAPYTRAVRRVARQLGGVLVGLALGSGAALGLAHIGVIKVLEREHIPIDIIAGSSIGALVGGLWAAGKSAAELEDLALRFKNPWSIRQLFLFDLSLPVVSLLIGLAGGIAMGWFAGFWAGFLFGVMACVLLGLLTGPLIGGPIQGTHLMAKLESDFGGKRFEETRIPLKIVATNPIAREEVVFDSGSIAEAVRASVSIPGIFKPVIRLGKLCIDGGVVNPVPVAVLKRSGANRIIAINVFPTMAEMAAHEQEMQRQRVEWDAQLAARSFPVRLITRLRQELLRSISPIVFDVIMRSMQSMEYHIAEVTCRQADVILRPSVPGSFWLEFYHPEKFIRRGEEEALRYLPILKRLTGMTDAAGQPRPPITGNSPAALTTPNQPDTIR